MSLTELTQRGEEFERMPPNDVAAEQCVLGGMLLSKDAISDVIEVIRPTDHYRPAHQLVHEAILDLYARGEPADPITVSNELTRRGELSRIGGAPYLHTLMAAVPTAANAGYYARIVRERAILRRLVEAGTRIVQFGYAGDADADDLVDRAQAEVYAVTDKRIAEDYHPLSEIMPAALEEIEAIGAHGGGISGVPTGFADLDSLTNGLHPGQMIVVAARPAVGKALALDTPLPTPDGWTTMGDVKVGDYLVGADGKPTRVVAATDVLHDRPCYEVSFDDGTAIIADEQHQWQTTTRPERRQAGQRVTRYHWTREQITRVHLAAALAVREPDRLVTTTEVVGEVGSEFLGVIKARLLKRVACAGREPRESTPRVSSRLGVRAYTHPVRVYSRREILGALADHVEVPVAAAQAHEHQSVKTTATIAATLYWESRSVRRLNHAVAVASPVDLPEQDLPLPPYVLGVWAGDGTSRSAAFTSADPEIASLVEAEGVLAPKLAGHYAYGLRLPDGREQAFTRNCRVCGKPFAPATSEVMTCGRACGGQSGVPGVRRRVQPTCPQCGRPFTGLTGGHGMCRACIDTRGSVQAILRALGVLGNKHIPKIYLRASEQQRRALLAGLLDTDGTVSHGGSVQFTVTSYRLARDVRELIVSLGYRCGWSQRPVTGRTPESSTAYTITFTTTDEVFRLGRKQTVHRDRRSSRATPRTSERFITGVRLVASVPVRCVQVDNSEHLYLASESMIPTHNSALALDFARSATIRHGLPTVVFSLEMGRNEITMRLLSAEARVPMHIMRTGQMSDDDWGRLAKRMSEVADAPLFIDDSPNMSLMEIRAKCRRLKQRHDLKLVIIDYLQLMSSPKRTESRQQEVSEMSRSLKLLAKELQVPVVALSQLNRGPEQRQDKKPMLSDLRESGCVTADTTLLRADTGAPISFEELMRDGWRDVLVWSLDDQRRLVPAPVVNVFESGTKEVFRLRLASGREVKATANHPFLAFSGWTALGDLRPGDRVGIPRRVPQPLHPGLGWSEHRIGLLAHLIGDGCVIKKQPVHYTSNDPENLAFVEAAAAAEFGISPRRVAQQTWWHVYLPAPEHCTFGRGNPIHNWFRELGIEYLGARAKRLPEVLYSATDAEISLFLRHLWATDGCVWIPRGKGAAKVYYASSSRELADGVARLLARLGIVARIRQVEKVGYEPGYQVIVADGPSLRTFCAQVGVHGRRGETARELAKVLADRATNTNVDTVPLGVWDVVKAERVRAGLTERQFQAAIGTNYCGTALYKSCPSRERLLRCADALGSETLREIASSDVFWDKIVSIEPLGPQPVYDATVKETHNFVANGINLHNSIEQDADVVILLHREDAYERESPRAGEADLIIAKHRNGPTATVTVAFQGHYSRFVDMAPA